MVSVGLALTFKLHWPWMMDEDLLWASEPRLRCRCQTHCGFSIHSCCSSIEPPPPSTPMCCLRWDYDLSQRQRTRGNASLWNSSQRHDPLRIQLSWPLSWLGWHAGVLRMREQLEWEHQRGVQPQTSHRISPRCGLDLTSSLLALTLEPFVYLLFHMA